MYDTRTRSLRFVEVDITCAVADLPAMPLFTGIVGHSGMGTLQCAARSRSIDHLPVQACQCMPTASLTSDAYCARVRTQGFAAASFANCQNWSLTCLAAASRQSCGQRSACTPKICSLAHLSERNWTAPRRGLQRTASQLGSCSSASFSRCCASSIVRS